MDKAKAPPCEASLPIRVFHLVPYDDRDRGPVSYDREKDVEVRERE